MFKIVPIPEDDALVPDETPDRVPYILWRSLADLDVEVRHWSVAEHSAEWLAHGRAIKDHMAAVERLKHACERVKMAIEYLARTP